MGKHLTIGGWSAMSGGKFLNRCQDAPAERFIWGRLPLSVTQCLRSGSCSIVLVHYESCTGDPYERNLALYVNVQRRGMGEARSSSVHRQLVALPVGSAGMPQFRVLWYVLGLSSHCRLLSLHHYGTGGTVTEIRHSRRISILRETLEEVGRT
jgi:hypothetical protein